MNRSRLRRRGARVAAVLAVAALLPGCTVARQAGAAAIVEDRTIPDSRVQELAAELRAVGLDDASQDPMNPAGGSFGTGGLQRHVVRMLVQGQILREVAAAEGVEVTQGDVDALLDQFVSQVGDREEAYAFLAERGGVPPSYVEEYVHEVLLTQELAGQVGEDRPVEAYLDERADELGIDVEVDPRYGEFTGIVEGIRPLPSAGLAVPEDEIG